MAGAEVFGKINMDEIIKHGQKAVAVSLYTKDDISVGYCAKIAGMTETEFMQYLGNQKISIFQYDNLSEFDDEVENAERYC